MVTLHWVSLPYATFRILTDELQVVAAAPIARWTIGKKKQYVYDYFLRKGAEFRVVS